MRIPTLSELTLERNGGTRPFSKVTYIALAKEGRLARNFHSAVFFM